MNGTALLSRDPELRASFTVRGAEPTTVIVISTTAVYAQCPKALVRSHLWDAGRHRDPAELPTVGQITWCVSGDGFDGAAYDRADPERSRRTLY